NESSNGVGALYTFPVDPSLLHSGQNSVRVKLATGASQDVSAFDMVVDQVFQRAYTTPAPPTERTPLGAWSFGNSPHVLVNGSAVAYVPSSAQQPGSNTPVPNGCGCCDGMDDRSVARRNAPAVTA